MPKQIMLVYQDCPMCGAREAWGEEQTKLAKTHGIEIVKTPFYQTGVKGLIWKACKAGMTLPFFTDGEHFSKDIIDFKEPDYIEDAMTDQAPEDLGDGLVKHAVEAEKPKTKKRSKKNGAKKQAS